MDNNLINKSQIEKIKDSSKRYQYVYESNNNKFSKMGNWLEKESTLFKKEVDGKKNNKPNFRRGEIIKVDFGINLGSELSNTHFAIVLNNDDNNNVDNLTSKSGYKRFFLGDILKPFGGKYNKDTYALITKITTISKTKVFKNNVKCYCKKDTLEKLNMEIIDFLT